MNLIGSALLLADRNMFRNMGAGFREKREHFDGLDVLLWILLAIGFFVFVGLLSWLLARSDKHQLFNSPRGLFRSLCSAHQLDRPALVVGADGSGRRDRSAGAIVSRARMLSPRVVAPGFGRKAGRDRGFGGPTVSAGNGIAPRRVAIGWSPRPPAHHGRRDR